jgi:hypothetical protein
MIVADEASGRAVSAVPTYGLSDGWLQRTALCADKSAAILKLGFNSIVFPIYRCTAADGQGVRRLGAQNRTRHGIPLDGVLSADLAGFRRPGRSDTEE